ncbi:MULTISPECIES: hypothetical protein [Aerococcus]|nr:MULTISPECIES: hypothetical protein [Aerococcus]
MINNEDNENCSDRFPAEYIDNKLESSYTQFLAKEGRPMEDVFRDLEKDF